MDYLSYTEEQYVWKLRETWHGVQKPAGGTRPPHLLNCRPPMKSYLTSHTILATLIPRRREEFLPHPGNSPANDSVTIQPKRSHHTRTPSFLQWIFLLKIVHTTLPYFYKRAFFSFDLGTCLQFCHSLLVLNGKSLLVSNKPIFVGEITDSFLHSYFSPLFSWCPWFHCLLFSGSSTLFHPW